MPHRAPRILTLVLATSGACLMATTAGAQSAAPGRYLTWANRPASTTPAEVTAAGTRPANGMIPRRVAPSEAPYRPMMQPTPTPLPASRGLTPASAWIGPRVTPAYAPGAPDPLAYASIETAAPPPTYSPPPPPVERAAPERQPQPRPVERVAADPMAPRRDAPVFNMPRPAAEAPAPLPAAVQPPEQRPVAAADTVDPMAPRRDARIFQLEQDQPDGRAPAAFAPPTQTASVGQPSGPSGQPSARYYSVHRDAGHRPDPTTLPEPVYFDSVTLDLAEPPAEETPARDPQGRRRVVPNEDPSLP